MTLSEKKLPTGSQIAVIGMGCLFPKASDLKAYWHLLLNGTDAVTDVPESHWLTSDYFDENPQTPPKFNIRSIPTLLLFNGGSVAAQQVGAVSKAQLETFLGQHLGDS